MWCHPPEQFNQSPMVVRRFGHRTWNSLKQQWRQFFWKKSRRLSDSLRGATLEIVRRKLMIPEDIGTIPERIRLKTVNRESTPSSINSYSDIGQLRIRHRALVGSMKDDLILEFWKRICLVAMNWQLIQWRNSYALVWRFNSCWMSILFLIVLKWSL
mgnify:CR=1 FL=1